MSEEDNGSFNNRGAPVCDEWTATKLRWNLTADPAGVEVTVVSPQPSASPVSRSG